MFSATHDLFADAHMLSPTHCPPSSETAPFISLHFPSDIPVTWLDKIWMINKITPPQNMEETTWFCCSIPCLTAKN